ncbi:MAG: AMP-binding protein [Syntrophorhabdales bacterium]
MKAVEDYGSSVAIRRKQLGLWREITWNDYGAHVEDLYHGFKYLGVRKGDVVCIVSTNRPEWVYTDLACQCIGALPLGIYPDCPDGELESLINHNRARFVVLEDQEQTDKLLRSLNRLPALEKCLVIDWRGMEEYDDVRLASYAETEKIGRHLAHEHPEELKQSVAELQPGDPAFLSLTSGTAGRPKTVILTHQAVLAIAESFTKVERLHAADELISCVPLAWITERCFSVVFHLKSGYRVNFPESTEADVLLQSMREIAPSVLNCTTGFWERLRSSVYSRQQNASLLKQYVFRAFMPIAARMVHCSYTSKPVPVRLALLNLLGDVLLLRKLRERLGLRLLRCAYTGGRPIGSEVYSFYHMIGVDIRQLYNLTEIGGPCVGQYPRETNPETAGRPFPGIELRLSESDEILIRAPNFVGYYDNQDLGAEVCKEGWLATGDRGRIDDKGQVKVIGRHAEMIETESGITVQPELIENALTFSPYVKRAVAVGKGRPSIGALIQIDRESVGSWAQRKGIPYTTFRDLTTKPEVIGLIGQEVEKVNQDLDRTNCVTHYTLLEKELESEDQELTRIGRPRRSLIENKYKNLIDSMYMGRKGFEQ